ncbi:GNAT family N-acetyltransferase [uncultured Rhodoblastus sp.]|uniref:GNAT family N-acetyltransferase n=1 Tax=uncultured Rhodoblastus sp. TaxID=543037 RepID=UPI0025DA649A|nr:GNAT family N-acetyltransferase [uncultured Rhodoblastus sp.]
MTKKQVPTKPFHIAREVAGSEASKLVSARLGREIAGSHGPRNEKTFTLAARDQRGEWIGGVNGVIHWRWLYISQFYLAPDWRRNGLGRALLAEVENFARETACVGLYLDTFEAGPLDFYCKCGFAISGRIENFPPGAERTFLSKAL